MLEAAIWAGDRAEVDNILLDDPVLIDGTDKDGLWLPFLAARLGNLEVMKYIVEYSRASFNTVDKDNRDVLHYGVASGNLELVKYLVERVGMSPLRGDVSLVTPYDIAAGMGFKEIEKYFEQVCGAKLQDMYRNPILTGMHPDPSIVCVGEDFYMVNSSFIYFPCIPISHSKDLIHWEVIGHAITNPEWAQLDSLEGGRGYWAPDISYYDGRFYITATYRLNDDGRVYRKQMVTSAEKPEGPYCEPVFLDEDGIDPSIFTDDDGKRYMLLNRGARIFEISADGKKQLSEAKLLYYGHQKRAPEGSHLLKKDGYYYLFQAEGGTGPGHRISVSRSKELFGIYEPCPYNPIMRQTDELADIQRCGHGKPVKTPKGEWYMVYLCGRQIDGKYSMLGRETAMDPIYWDAEGWPMVNRLQGPSVLQKKPDLPQWKPDGSMERQGINPLTGEARKAGDILTAEWVTPRPPVEGAIKQQDGWVELTGSREPLSSMYARNILLRRQEHFRFDFSTILKVPKLEDGQHVGITAYYDENTYVRYSVKCKEDIYIAELVEHIGLETVVAHEVTLTGMQVSACIRLEMNTDYLQRRFSITVGEGLEEEQLLDECLLENVYYLCDEGIKMGKRFTGAMAGIYAYAGKEQTLKAEFTKLDYMAKS
ncbi:MAG: family 43 glycosylhydrolase [Lachnospiraceae bacterium]|nr:family 43 glycosylhydrolase [Lachnospiraceae bacterium]